MLVNLRFDGADSFLESSIVSVKCKRKNIESEERWDFNNGSIGICGGKVPDREQVKYYGNRSSTRR